MEILDIIKEAFVFPSQNLGKLAIYIVLTFIVGLFMAGGIILAALSLSYQSNVAFAIIGIILFIVGLAVSFIISGYQISLIKSGIDRTDEAPSVVWKNDIVTGIKSFIVGIIYMIIPAIIVAITALITNIPGQIADIIQKSAVANASVSAASNSTVPAVTITDAAMNSLLSSVLITAIVAIILVVIFMFLLVMGQSRLANTGSLAHSLNIVEAFKDITRIGAGKVIAVVLLIFIVFIVINGVLGYIYGRIPQLSLISVLVSPYLAFFAQRATGLLYSDIA